MRLRIGRHVAVIALAGVIVSSGVAGGQERMPAPTRWTIGGVNREALVFPPSRPTGERPPVVFVFQGHGGTMQRMARLGFQQELPEAVIVCPQGIPTASRRDPQGRRWGWQQSPGDEGDRDLAFVDAIVPFGLQERTVEAVRRLNGCEEEGAPWASAGDLSPPAIRRSPGLP